LTDKLKKETISFYENMLIREEEFPRIGMAAIGADKKVVKHCQRVDQKKMMEI